MQDSKPSFSRIEQKNLSQEALEALRGAILRGTIAPGAHLNEREIAEQMGISGIPLREALRRLTFEGVVVSMPNRGSFVRYLTKKDLVEMFDLRSVLEGMACQIILAKQKLTETDFQSLQEFIDTRNAAIDADDYDTWLENEIGFHDYSMPKAGSERASWRPGRISIFSVFLPLGRDGRDSADDGTHPVILDALRRGDPTVMIPLHQELYDRERTGYHLA